MPLYVTCTITPVPVLQTQPITVLCLAAAMLVHYLKVSSMKPSSLTTNRVLSTSPKAIRTSCTQASDILSPVGLMYKTTNARHAVFMTSYLVPN